ncbi:hypothetical protein OFM36_36340, partial [Escherichia coli]|nr:hypothetical protein [Escherichia coli]
FYNSYSCVAAPDKVPEAIRRTEYRKIGLSVTVKVVSGGNITGCAESRNLNITSNRISGIPDAG